MYRVLYTVAVVTLLGASAVTASGIEKRGGGMPGGAGLVLLATLQR